MRSDDPSSRKGFQARAAREVASNRQSRSQGAAESPIHVAVLTDNRLFEEGLCQLIASDPALTLVKCEDGSVPLAFLGRDSTDIVLADARMERSFPICTELQRAGTRPWVILLGAENDDEWVLKALKAGARGILSEEVGGELVRSAIRIVHAGQIWASRRILAVIVAEFANLIRTPSAAEPSPFERLTVREQDIARRVVEGLSNEEIAERLSISEATVKAHLTSIFQKLRVRSRGQLSALYHHTVASSAPG